MKRWLLRLSALSGVVVLGLIAIAQAQRSAPSDNSDNGTPTAAASRDPFALRPDRPLSGHAQPADEPGRFSPDSSARVIAVEDQPAAKFNGAARPASDLASTPPNAQRPGSASNDPFKSRDSQVLQAAAPADSGTGYDGGSRYTNSARGDIHPLAAAAPAQAYEDHDARPLNAGPALGPAAASNGANPFSHASDPPGTASVMKRDGAATNALRPVTNDARPESQPAIEGTGRPGAKQLDGAQSPHLTIEKIVPAEVQVGKTAKFEIRVRNEGNVTAQGVEIHDEVPKGTQLVSTTPAASQGEHGELVWSLGALSPGQQAVAQLDLMPITEGEIGSVASVAFRADASARTIATRPQLSLEISAPKQVMIGADATLTIRLSNPGTGAATGIVVSERVPTGLRHPAGGELEFDVGTLKPGESRQVDLTLNAVQAGHMTNLVLAHGDGNLKAEEKAEFDVVAPALAVAMTGPSRRYLERQATYTVSVSNPGTAPAKDVQLVTQLPKGLKFVKANNSGQFDPNTNTVTWSLEELPATETGSVTLVAVPIEVGEQKMRVQGKARQGLSDEKEQTVVVEGLASLAFDVQASDEAIEIGGETTYQIHIVNQGSKAASNVQIAAIFPAELKATRAEGPSRETIEDHRVQFEPLARLAPKAEATFRIRAQALQAGDLRVKVQLLTDDAHQPVTKEESTRVYSDQ